jgi:hypothetical protein
MKLRKDLDYPVFAVFADGTMNVADTPDQLGVCNSRGLKNGCFNGMTVITVKGEKLIVTQAKEIGIFKPWWTKPMFLVLLMAELEMELVSTVPLDELKQLFLKAARKAPSMYDGLMDEDEFVSKVESCTSAGELAEVLNG